MIRYRTYHEYLALPEFRKVCRMVADRSAGICELCWNTATEFHHVRYCRWGDVDTAENLQHLCHTCHCDAHTCGQCGELKLKAKHVKLKTTVCDDCRGAG